MWKGLVALVDWVDKKLAYKHRMEDKVDQALELLKDHEKRLLRFEIIEAMKRNDVVTVCDLMKEYKAKDGNFYMDKLFEDFMKKWKKSKKK